MDPNGNEFGDSLLVLACEGGHRAVVEVLLSYSSLEIMLVALYPSIHNIDLLLRASTHGHSGIEQVSGVYTPIGEARYVYLSSWRFGMDTPR